MKKTVHLLIFLFSLIVCSIALSADGQTPKCDSGKLNLEIYNQNLSDDNCSSRNGEGKYCISLSGFEEKGCFDSEGVLWKNFNDSFSFSSVNKNIDITYDVSNKTQAYKNHVLHLTYHGGQISDNCAQVFGPDVSCSIIKTYNSSNHIVYVLKIYKNS